MKELPWPAYKLFSNTDAWSSDQVLAIQKQAYEDGLNELMKRILESQVRRMGSASDYGKGGLRACQELEGAVNALLKSSQKEPQ